MVIAKGSTKKYALSFLLYLLPVLAFLNLVKYESRTFEIIVLLTTFAVMLGIFFLSQTNRKPSVLLLLIINVASLMVTAFFYSSWGSVVQFANLLLMMFSFNNLAISKKAYRRVHFISFSLLLFYLLTTRIIDGNLSRIYDLWGNRINPNLIATLFFATFLHLVCYVDMLKISKRAKGFVKFISAVLFAVKIYSYESRSILISFALFWILCLLLKKGIKYSKLKGIVVSVLVISVLFSFAYVLLYDKLGDVRILGKSLYTGRELIWKSAFEQIFKHPIFGSGNTVQFNSVNGTTTYASHHTLLGLWKILGIIPLGTFLFCFIRKRSAKAAAYELNLPKIIIISVLPICFFESFYIDAAIYVYFALFLLRYIESEDSLHDT